MFRLEIPNNHSSNFLQLIAHKRLHFQNFEIHSFDHELKDHLFQL